MQRRLAQRERAGFVEDDMGDQAKTLERFTGAHQDAAFGRLAGAAHDRQRRRDAQCARIAHHQHAEAGEHRAVPVGYLVYQVGQDDPPGHGQQRERQHGGGIHDEHAVDQVQHARLQGARIFHLARHATQEALLAHRRDAHQQGAQAIHRAANHLVSRLLFHRHGFARDQRLVDR